MRTAQLGARLEEHHRQDRPQVAAGQVVLPGLLRLLRWSTVRARRVLPLGLSGDRLVLGMLDPCDLAAIAQAEFESAKLVVPVRLSPCRFREALEQLERDGYGERPLRLPADAVRAAEESPP